MGSPLQSRSLQLVLALVCIAGAGTSCGGPLALSEVESPAAAVPTAGPRLGPRAVLADPVFDWGSVEEGAEIVHAFVLRNEGDELLQVLRARPT